MTTKDGQSLGYIPSSNERFTWYIMERQLVRDDTRVTEMIGQPKWHVPYMYRRFVMSMSGWRHGRRTLERRIARCVCLTTKNILDVMDDSGRPPIPPPCQLPFKFCKKPQTAPGGLVNNLSL